MSRYVLNKQNVKRSFPPLIAIVFSFTLFLSIASSPAKNSEALSGSEFKAGRIVDDSVFFSGNAMSASQVQQFLNAKVPTCDTNGTQQHWSGQTRASYGTSQGYPPPYTCLKDFRMNTPFKAGVSGQCAPLTAKSNRTAAQIIDDVSRACGVSQKVLLVLLQKEQSLVTDDWPWSIQYRSATGYGCPDTAPCDSEYYGYFNQVYQAAKAYKRYRANPTNYNYRAGRNNTILWHPNGACGTSTVYIQNQATAGLYIYTPYRPNAAALNNLYGTGDGCSSYGNRNFWRMFRDWFGQTTKSVLFKVGSSNTYFLEWGSHYYSIPSYEMLEAYGLTKVAPRTLSSFPAGLVRGPALTRSAKFGSDDPGNPDYTGLVEIVDNGKRHGVPNWSTLTRHGFSGYTNYPAILGYLLRQGDNLAPVVRKPNGAIFVIESNKKRGFPDGESYSNISGPDAVGTVRTYSSQTFTNMSATYIDKKADGAPMLLDGKLIATYNSPAIFLYDNGQKKLLSASAYSMWGGKYDYKFSKTSVNQIPSGANAPLLVKSGSGGFYLVSQGKKRPFGSGTLAEWGLDGTDFTLVTDRALSRLPGTHAATRLINDGKPGVFYVQGGELHGVPSIKDFNGLGFKWSDISRVGADVMNLLPRGADIYAPGSLVRTPNGAVFEVDNNYSAFGVTSGAIFSRFGLKWSNVSNVTEMGLNGYTISNLETLLRDDSSGKYYLAEGGRIHFMSSEAMSSAQYDFSARPFSSVHPKFISALKLSDPLTRFLRGNSPTVYYIEDGAKRPIPTEAKFFSVGGSWSKVIDVSDDFLAEIPSGPAL